MKYLSVLAFLIVLNISCSSAATDENPQASGQLMKIPTQIRKAKRSFAIKAPLSQMHDFWNTQLPLMSTICPDQVHNVDVLEGQWGNQGCVVVFKFYRGAELTVGKTIMEVIDKENNRIVFKSIEGGPLDEYKSFSWIYQASPDSNVVQWTLEYAADSQDVSEPNAYLDLISSMMKRIDAHLTGA